MSEFGKIDKGTIVSGIALVLAMINIFLVNNGYQPLPVEAAGVYAFASELILVATGAWAWYRNNSTSKIAIESDKVMRAAKLREKLQKLEK